jgi:hypothetical protein
MGIIFLIWLIYLEYSSKLGNIWWRINSKGQREFQFEGIIQMIFYPWKSWDFWYPRMWDLNIYVILLIFFLLYIIVLHFESFQEY